VKDGRNGDREDRGAVDIKRYVEKQEELKGGQTDWVKVWK